MKNLMRAVIACSVLMMTNQPLLFGQWFGPVDVFTTQIAQNPAVGVDANGNAVIIATASDDGTTYYEKGAQLVQGVVQNLHNFPAIGSNLMNYEFIPSIAVNSGGNAAASWVEFDDGTTYDFTRAVLLTNNIWGTPTTLSDPMTDSVYSFTLTGVILDDSNEAISAWNGQNATQLEASQYVAPNWSDVQDIPGLSDNPANFLLIGSPSGNNLLMWASFSPILYLSNYNGSSWSSQEVTTDVFRTCIPLIAASMNVHDNSMLIWNNASTSGISSVPVSGTVLGSIQNFYAPAMNEMILYLAVALDNSGNAIAVWISQIGDTTYQVITSRYTGGIWGTPLVLDTTDSGNAFANPSVAVDGKGNAYVVYEKDDLSSNGTIYYNQYTSTSNSWLDASVLLSSPGVLSSKNPKVSMNELGGAAVVWSTDPVSTQSIQIVYTGNPAPTAPSHLKGNQVKTRFLTQTAYNNEIRWSASTTPSVISYNIYRNGELVATVPATSPLFYQDPNARKKEVYTYEVTAVNAQGLESTPISVDVP